MSSRSPYVKGFPQPTAGPIVPTPSGFIIPGIAIVEARPHRTPRQAKAFARRIAASPADYLAAVADHHVPGIRDLRAGKAGAA